MWIGHIRIHRTKQMYWNLVQAIASQCIVGASPQSCPLRLDHPRWRLMPGLDPVFTFHGNGGITSLPLAPSCLCCSFVVVECFDTKRREMRMSELRLDDLCVFVLANRKKG